MKWWCVVSLLVLSIASARLAWSANRSPDEQAARRHFERGAARYETERYREAIAELERARTVMPTPALDFNIGRTYERLEEWSAAADGFERYLRNAHDAADRETVAARIVTLRGRCASAKIAPTATTMSTPATTLVPAPPIAVTMSPTAPTPTRNPMDRRWRVASIAVGVSAGATVEKPGAYLLAVVPN